MALYTGVPQYQWVSKIWVGVKYTLAKNRLLMGYQPKKQ
jgi:hypothetical protein